MKIFSNKKRNGKKVVGFLAVVLVILIAGYYFVNRVGGPILYKNEISMAEDAVMSRESSGGFAGNTVTKDAYYAGDYAMGIAPSPMSPSGAPEVADRDIIRSGNLSLVVVDVEVAIEGIKALALAEPNGFVAESSVQDVSDDTKSGWITVRVPGASFDKVMTAIKEVAEKVESENVRADDVTKQVVDMEARLVNLRAQEEQYRQILTTAKTVEETIMVTDNLNRVRWEIESIETQLKNLNEQVDFSTIYVSLVDQGDVEVFGVYWKPLVEVKQALRGAVENVTASVDVLFVLLFNLPLALIWGVIVGLGVWLGWRVVRWVWERWG